MHDLQSWSQYFDALIFYEILLSPKVKQSLIIRNKHGIYELPHELRRWGGFCAHTRKKKRL